MQWTYTSHRSHQLWNPTAAATNYHQLRVLTQSKCIVLQPSSQRSWRFSGDKTKLLELCRLWSLQRRSPSFPAQHLVAACFSAPACIPLPPSLHLLHFWPTCLSFISSLLITLSPPGYSKISPSCLPFF